LFGIDAAGQSQELIYQIILRKDCNDHTIRLCCLLPFYSIDTKEYIGSPEIYPRSVMHISCHNVVELVNISKIVDVDVNDVTGLGFVFHESDVTDLKYHIQGMTYAFIVHYQYCPETRDLLPLSPTTFQCFPDLNATYNNLWCECLGRTIFMSIDYLRQVVWRFFVSIWTIPRPVSESLFKNSMQSTVCSLHDKFFRESRNLELSHSG